MVCINCRNKSHQPNLILSCDMAMDSRHWGDADLLAFNSKKTLMLLQMQSYGLGEMV